MFKEIYGNKEVNVDDKHRIYLNSFVKVNETDRLCFLKDENYYRLYYYTWVNNKLDELLTLRKNCDEEEYHLIVKELYSIYFAITKIANVDSCGRIILPPSINSTSVILQGMNDHIIIFSNENDYTEYIRKNTLKNLDFL